jgi:hypothetical protein
MKKEFSFSHLNKTPSVGEPMHFHAYKLEIGDDKNYHIRLHERLSTDSDGIATAMGLMAEAKIELELILKKLESKISEKTLFTI